jgi:hypothetical protein
MCKPRVSSPIPSGTAVHALARGSDSAEQRRLSSWSESRSIMPLPRCAGYSVFPPVGSSRGARECRLNTTGSRLPKPTVP